MKKFDLNDILIQPSVTTAIRHRDEINPFDKNGFLPLITAPMDTVIGANNSLEFSKRKINVCLPRNEEGKPFEFESFGMEDFEDLVKKSLLEPNGYYLIDIANGHMKDLVYLVKLTKKAYKDLTLMVGNIANPETYVKLSNAGADLIRCGIGNGNGCLTTFHTGVGYPMGSLIHECYEASLALKNPAKIVADGGMKTYSDIIKALALGADYVMVGSIFNKALESSGDSYLWNRFKLSHKKAKWCYNHKLPIYKKFRGMSTKEVQKKWGAKKIKTSEGVVRYRKVEYTLNKWVENFMHYLQTAMSYCGAKNLEEFIGVVKFNLITENGYNRFVK